MPECQASMVKFRDQYPSLVTMYNKKGLLSSSLSYTKNLEGQSFGGFKNLSDGEKRDSIRKRAQIERDWFCSVEQDMKTTERPFKL